MNLSSYENKDRLANPVQNYMNPMSARYDNSGEIALAKANARAIGALGGVYNEAQEMYDTGKAMEANNEYNRLMAEGTSELMQKKEQNALNVVEEYDKLHQKTMSAVRAKFGNVINYGKAGQAFNIFTEKDNNTRRQNMLNYQRGELVAYRNTQFNNQKASCIQMVVEGNNSDASIDGAFNRVTPMIETAYANYGKEKIQEQKRLFKSQLVTTALQGAMAVKDYNRISELCGRYRNDIDPSTLTSYVGMLRERNKQAREWQEGKDAWSALGAHATPQQVAEYARRNKPSGGYVNTLVDSNNMSQAMTCMKEAVGGQESGGNYEAFNDDGEEGEGRGARGKYQILDSNWDNWCIEAGLPAGSPWTPENQELVFEHKMGEYLKNYGVRGAAIAWYAGEANAERYVNGMPTAIGEGGEYAWDAPQVIDGTEYPSVIEYTDSVEERYHRIAGTEMNEDYESYDYEQRVMSQYNKFKSQYDNQVETLKNQGQMEMLKLYNAEVMDVEQYRDIARQYGMVDGVANDDVLQPLLRYANTLANKGLRGSGAGAKEDDATAYFVLDELLRNGTLSCSEARAWVAEHNYKNAQSLYKQIDDFANNEGQYSLKWDGLKERLKAEFFERTPDDFFEQNWALSSKYAADIYRDYEAQNGHKPTQEEMYQWLLEGITHPKIVTSKGWLFDTTEETLSNAQLYDRGVYDIRFDEEKDCFIVKLSDGEEYPITKEQYEQIKAGQNANDVVFEGGGYIG